MLFNTSSINSLLVLTVMFSEPSIGEDMFVLHVKKWPDIDGVCFCEGKVRKLDSICISLRAATFNKKSINLTSK